MTGVLWGELTEDRQRIVLIAGGDDYEMAQIGAQLKRMTPLLTRAQIDGRDLPGAPLYCPATWPAVVQLGFSFNQAADLRWAPQPRLLDWITAEATRRTSVPSPLSAEFPPWLALRPYQADGAAEIAAEGRFLLNDDPGVGKTITTIAGVEERRVRGTEIFPMIIVVPSWDVADHWRREITAWTPAWGTPRMHGGPKRAQGITGRNRRQYARDVFITTYATLRRDALPDDKGPLCKLRAVTVILDEGHLIKNSEAVQSKAARRVSAHADTVITLTGTPVTRDTGDVYPALDAMDPRSWPDKKRFGRRYLATVEDEDGYEEKVTGLNHWAEPEFRACLLGQMRRVAKADVLDQLPPKIYSVRYVQVPAEWRKAYDSMEEDMLAALPDGQELPVFSVLEQLTRLSQLASSAADVEELDEVNPLTGRRKIRVTLKAPSWKADSLLEILAERPGHPVAAFTPSRQLAVIAGQAAEKAGVRTGYVTGLGEGITRKSRTAAIEDFQAGKLDLIMVTTGAGGTGITLTAAGTGVFLQRPWPLAESVQSEDRVHRIGSEIHEHGVEIIDIIAEDTVESRVRARLREKAGQLASFVRDPRIVKELLGGIRK